MAKLLNIIKLRDFTQSTVHPHSKFWLFNVIITNWAPISYGASKWGRTSFLGFTCHDAVVLKADSSGEEDTRIGELPFPVVCTVVPSL